MDAYCAKHRTVTPRRPVDGLLWCCYADTLRKRLEEARLMLQDARAFAYEARHMSDAEIADSGRSLRRRIQALLTSLPPLESE